MRGNASSPKHGEPGSGVGAGLAVQGFRPGEGGGGLGFQRIGV